MNERPPSQPPNPESEHTEQEQLELISTKRFLTQEIKTTDKLTPEQKEYVTTYILANVHRGDWRHYNGKDFLLDAITVEADKIVLSFKFIDEEYGVSEDSYTNIPL